MNNSLRTKIQTLALANRLILIDVNGTLWGEDDDESQRESLLAEVRRVGELLQAQGFMLGLASDSPANKLERLAELLGLQGPILAENGNIIVHQDKTITVKSLAEVAKVRSGIREVLADSAFREVEDQSPLQFSGSHVLSPDVEWSFGANRKTSVTVYGPAKALTVIYEAYKDRPGMSVDIDLESNFLAIHPKGWRKNKMRTVALLKDSVEQLVMIGDSMSDWLPPSSGVECGFVGNAVVSGSVKQQCAYTSEQALRQGVIDILFQVQEMVSRNINILEPLTNGEINKTVLVSHQGQPAVLQYPKQYTNQNLSFLSPYFHPDKVEKIDFLTGLLRQNGLPAPRIVASQSRVGRPWILFELARGVNLDDHFNTLSESQKLNVVQDMAARLAGIHAISQDFRGESFQKWTVEMDRTRLIQGLTCELEKVGVLSASACCLIQGWHAKNSSLLWPARLGLVHRDFFQRNVFVDLQSLKITDIIDWGDTAHIGDTVKDTILAAKWIAGDLLSSESQLLFRHFIESYNTVSQTKIHPDSCQEWVKIYLFEWYLEAALLTHYMNNQQQVDKQISRVMSMIKE